MPKRNPFLPFINDYEEEAEIFLAKYNCEDAINTPKRIPIRDIAKLMSLDVIQTEYLSRDESVQGAIAFDGGIIDVYDPVSEEFVGYEVSTGMVFIDAGIINEGRINNTLAHECFHWYKHRHYFTYRRAHGNETGFAFRCEYRSPNRNDSGERLLDEERMEMQARIMAPKILMPQNAARILIQRLHEKSIGVVNRSEATELIIMEFAKFYGVSKQSAAIRMVELGYEPACPFCEYVPTGHDEHDRDIQQSRAKKRQQPISIAAVFELYTRNEFLRSLLDTDVFCYADGYFALKDRKYVVKDVNGHFFLTDYARAHLAECTLDFSTKLVSHTQYAAGGAMYRSGVSYVRQESLDASAQNIELFNKSKTLGEIVAEFESDYARSVGMNFSGMSGTEMMWAYVKKAGWTNTEFQLATELAPADYTRLQKNHNFKIEAFMAMAVGLGLTLSETENVLRASGMTFVDINHDHQAYKCVLTVLHGCSINECNDFLLRANVDPLGTRSRA